MQLFENIYSVKTKFECIIAFTKRDWSQVRGSRLPGRGLFLVVERWTVGIRIGLWSMLPCHLLRCGPTDWFLLKFLLTQHLFNGCVTLALAASIDEGIQVDPWRSIIVSSLVHIEFRAWHSLVDWAVLLLECFLFSSGWVIQELWVDVSAWRIAGGRV